MSAPSPTGPAFLVEGLSAGYGRVPVIRDLSLDAIAPGEVVALVGPNAAGKSTLLRGMAGLLKASGAVRLDGRNLLPLPPAERASLVTYMPQTLPRRVSFTVFEGVVGALTASRRPGGGTWDARRQAMEALDRLGILHLALERLDRLSGGQRQIASLAQALAREPRVLLLDEPTSALDLNYQLRVMALVREVARERGMVAVVVLHDLTLACRWADRIAVLEGGRLAAMGPPEATVTPGLLRQVYAVEAQVDSDPNGHLRITVDRPSEAGPRPAPSRSPKESS